MIKEIQALRGIAVLLVVFHHYGGWVPSGFVGVDVFFVISGYVVTRSVLRRLNGSEGKFSFWGFMRDRFVRLAPALIFLVLAFLGFQLATSPRFSYQAILESGLFSMGYISNIYSQIKLGDYFGEVAATGPFLHTWSLSVEFQIYVALGIVLMLCISRRSKRLNAMFSLLVLSLFSVGVVLFGELFQHSITATEYLSGYYSPLTRFYEVAVGAIIAFLPSGKKFSRSYAALGLVLIVIVSFLPLDLLSWRFTAAVGVIGSALCILGFTSPSAKKGFFTTSVFSRVGDYSYSIYLWHWPIWVTVSSIGLDETSATIASLGLTSVFSWLSYVGFERPFLRLKDLGKASGARQIKVLIIAPLTVLAVFAFSTLPFGAPPKDSAALGSDGSKQVLDGDVTEKGFAQEMGNLLEPCDNSPHFISPNIGKQYLCNQNSSDSELDVLIVGNSHAGHLIPGLSSAYPDLSFRYYSLSGGISTLNPNFLDAIALIKSHGVSADKLVVNSFWALDQVVPADIQLLAKSLNFAPENVLIFNDVPDFKIDPARCKYQKLFLLPSPCSEALPKFLIHKSVFESSIKSGLPGFQLIDSAGFFRVEGTDEFFIESGGKILYRDGNHLNFVGSVALFERLKLQGLKF